MPSHRINFTKAALGALPPAASGFDFYFDTNKAAPRGFGMWVTTGGAKTFALYRKVAGRPERIKIGAFPDMTIEQARKRAETLNATIADGGNPNDLRRAAREELTLSALFDEYVARHLKPKTKGWQDSRANFENHLAHWRARKLSQLKRADVQAWHAKLGTDHGRYMANRCLQLLRAAINWGIKEAALIDSASLDGESNPAAGIRLFAERKRDRFLQPDEAARFLAAVEAEPSADMRDLFLLALLTGARKMNVAAMRWRDVSFERAEWRIPDTKNREPHTVPLVPQALDILRQRKARYLGSDFVFASPSATGHIVSPKKAWRRVLDRAELHALIRLVAQAKGWDAEQLASALAASRRNEAKALAQYRAEARGLNLDTQAAPLHDLRIHDLRRTLGSWQAVQGASLPIIGKALGHKSAAATQIYARLNLDPVRQSMQAATAALLAQAHASPADATGTPPAVPADEP